MHITSSHPLTDTVDTVSRISLDASTDGFSELNAKLDTINQQLSKKKKWPRSILRGVLRLLPAKIRSIYSETASSPLPPPPYPDAPDDLFALAVSAIDATHKRLLDNLDKEGYVGGFNSINKILKYPGIFSDGQRLRLRKMIDEATYNIYKEATRYGLTQIIYGNDPQTIMGEKRAEQDQIQIYKEYLNDMTTKGARNYVDGKITYSGEIAYPEKRLPIEGLDVPLRNRF